MRLGDVPHDGEPEAAPLDVVDEAGRDAVETVEDLRLLVLRDADAVVGDGDDGEVALALEDDVDVARDPGVLHGVVEEIGERLADRRGVERDRRQRRRRRLPAEAEAGLLEARAEGAQRLAHDLFEIGRDELVALPARFDPRQVEDVVDQLGEPAALGLDVLAVDADLLRRLGLAQPQQLAEHPDRGERRAQLVRDVGDEVALHLRETHRPRGGAQREEHAAGHHRGEQAGKRQVDGEVAPRPAGRRVVAAVDAQLPVAEEEGQVARGFRRAPRGRAGGGVEAQLAPAAVASGDHRQRSRIPLEARQRVAHGAREDDLLEVRGVDQEAGQADELARVVGDRIQDEAVPGIALLDLKGGLVEGPALVGDDLPRCDRHVDGALLLRPRRHRLETAGGVVDRPPSLLAGVRDDEEPLDAGRLLLLEVVGRLAEALGGEDRRGQVENAFAQRAVVDFDAGGDRLEEVVEGGAMGVGGGALEAFEPQVLQAEERHERHQRRREHRPALPLADAPRHVAFRPHVQWIRKGPAAGFTKV